MCTRQLAAVDRLGDAATGSRGRVAGTYEKSVTNYPHVIPYGLDTLPGGGERVVVLHVIHTARNWPKANGRCSTSFRRGTVQGPGFLKLRAVRSTRVHVNLIGLGM